MLFGLGENVGTCNMASSGGAVTVGNLKKNCSVDIAMKNALPLLVLKGWI